MTSFLLALVGGITAGAVFIAFDWLRAKRMKRKWVRQLTKAVTEGIDEPGDASSRVPMVLP